MPSYSKNFFILIIILLAGLLFVITAEYFFDVSPERLQACSETAENCPEEPAPNPAPIPDEGVNEVPPDEFVACTMDALQCPDGSFVGRIAPNCEFSACTGDVETQGNINQSVDDAYREFKFELEETSRIELRQPIEGYEPQMLMTAFPGLQPWDFDGVEAQTGYYLYHHGELNHEYEVGTLLHSAAPAITEQGYRRLYENVTLRMGYDNPLDVRVDHVLKLLAIDWKTYVSTNTGISFRYPSKLELSEAGGVVTLHHSIPYENSGPCDMMGDSNILSDRLTDFKMSLELVNGPVELDYNDGTFSAGSLSGVSQYRGAEGCGDTYYYFEIDNTITLLVKFENIQALFTGVNSWEREAILSVPGVIDNQERLKFFEDIIGSFKINKLSQTNQIECLPESREVEACIEIYQPVCGLAEVQCITTPCNPVPETFSNSCNACAQGNVISYTVGQCE